MKKIIHLSLFGLAVSLLFYFTLPSLAVGTFLDIADSPYKDSIQFLLNEEIVQGYENGEFRPTHSINRAELLKIVFAALDESSVDYPGHCFPDVREEWFAPYVCKAKDLGIVKGYPDGLYRPAQEVNMVEALKIANEAFGTSVRAAEAGEQWYVPYMESMHENNILSKFSYFPERSAQRGELSYWVHQLLLIHRGERSVSTLRDARSIGCGSPQPASAPTQFTVAGETRSTITVVPTSYDPNTPLALIVAFHGRTNSNSDVQGYYGIEKPTKGQAIIVYPAGIQVNESYTWSNAGDAPGELRDYEFFDKIVEGIGSAYCINEDEIFAVGHSLGAWFTNSLACARGDVLRGVATLGGSRSQSECTGPVAVMQWHNPNDQLAPFSTALPARDQYLEQNVCSAAAVDVEPYWANCVQYLGCYETAPTLWCPHTNDYSDYSGQYYPHNWPRGTGEEMWNFLSQLPD